MSSLDDLIAKAKQQLESPSTTAVEIVVGGELIEFEFERMPSNVWLDLTAARPPREGSKRDSALGHNAHAVAKAAAPLSGYRLVDGVREDLSEDSWSELFEVFAAPDIELIATVLWGLNVYEPSQRIRDLKKAQSVESPTKPDSPAK